MTNKNALIKAKIEVDDIKSYVQQLPVSFTVAFTVGEEVEGVNSGAFAKVVAYNNGLLSIRNRQGYFDFNEVINGSITGIGATTGSMITGDSLYDNVDLGIVSGLWTIITPGDLSIDIKDAVKKINLDEGGNMAGGYTFGFTLENSNTVKPLIDDGVFLQNLPVRYYIDFDNGSGWVQVWTGIMDTFPRTGSMTAEFTCIDSTRNMTRKIGSDEVPICLNLNYNCRLPTVDVEKTEYIFRGKEHQEDYGSFRDVYNAPCWHANRSYNSDKGTAYYCVTFSFIYDDSEWVSELESGERLFLLVSAGEQAGQTFTVTGYIREDYSSPSPIAAYQIMTLEDPTGVLGIRDGGNTSIKYKTNTSLFKLVSYKQKRILSNKQVREVHKKRGSFSKPMTIYSDENEYPVSSPEVYNDSVNFTTGIHSVIINGIDEDKKITTKDVVDIDSSNQFIEDFSTSGVNIFSLRVDVTINISDMKEFADSKGDGYIDLKQIYIANLFQENLTSISQIKTRVLISGVYRDDITYQSGVKNEILPIKNISDQVEYTYFENDFIANFNLFDKDSIILENFSDSDVYQSVVIAFYLYGGVNKKTNPDVVADFTGLGFVSETDITVEEVSLGCSGENVSEGNIYEGYPETIKYIETEYGGIDIADINEASYAQAEDDYNIFPSNTDRNPAPQIEEQKDLNNFLKDILYYSLLASYQDRFGKKTLSNWLVKSKVFSDSTVTKAYNESNYTRIGDIKRPRLIKVVSDYELKFNYNEATGKYKNVIRIKNTDQSSFDFERDVEGVPLPFKQTAFECWDLFSAGDKRLKAQSQTVKESIVIKALFPDGTGVGEALNFIRNIAGHKNREVEKIDFSTILSQEDAIKELSSFDSVSHPKKTNGEPREGWLVEHRISWKAKSITSNYMLDIDGNDPFLVQVGMIQDTHDSTDEINDDNTAVDEINDGRGL